MSAAHLQPHEFPRRILLAVSGISPQILTETLYKLAVDSETPFVPTEIHLISTARGVDLARSSLLANGDGHYYRLLQDYGLGDQGIQFGPDHLHVIADEQGTELSDIHDEGANRSAADFILEVVRDLCSDDQSAVHASMAGGRKTMGFYLGYAMSLLGRSQDRLSHILVSPPFESCRDFFFPPAQPTDMVVDGMQVNTAAAKLTLADIPFVRLSTKLALESLQEGLGYSQTVSNIQRGLDEPSLYIDFDQGKARAHGQWLKLSPKLFAVFAWLTIRASIGVPQIRISGHESQNAAALLRVMEEVNVPERSSNSLEQSGSYGREEFGTNRSRLNKDLARQLGPAANHYQIAQTGKRPHASYALGLSPEQIEIKGFGHKALIKEILEGVKQ